MVVESQEQIWLCFQKLELISQLSSAWTSESGMSSRSRTPSRASTPNPALIRSPSSRLAVPALRPSSSLSNIRAHSYNSGSSTIPPVPSLPHQTVNSVLDSSASSVANLDLNDGILIQDLDADVEPVESEDVALGQVDARAGDEDSKKSLRDQLRKTLSQRPSKLGELAFVSLPGSQG